MLVTVQTNSLSMTAARAYGTAAQNEFKSLKSLSTGRKINTAADGAADLSIAETQVTLSRGIERARLNNVEAGSMVQIAEGGLAKISDEIQRIRELTVQAYSDVNSEEELAAIQNEINSRVKNITAFAGATEYNGIEILNRASDISFQLGAGQGETYTLKLGTGVDTGIDMDVSVLTGGSISEHSTVALDDFNIGSTTVASNGGAVGANGSLDDIDQMLENISRMRGFIGAAQNYFDSKLQSTLQAQENSEATYSRIVDTDVAKVTAEYAKSQLLKQSSTAMLSQGNLVAKDIIKLLPGL
jgi:flagellin